MFLFVDLCVYARVLDGLFRTVCRGVDDAVLPESYVGTGDSQRVFLDVHAFATPPLSHPIAASGTSWLICATVLEIGK